MGLQEQVIKTILKKTIPTKKLMIGIMFIQCKVQEKTDPLLIDLLYILFFLFDLGFNLNDNCIKNS